MKDNESLNVLEDGIEKVLYYYIRTPKVEVTRRVRGKDVTLMTGNAPVVTVCLILAPQCIYRGVAVCSASDNPHKVKGRGLAYQRALLAMLLQGNSLFVDFSLPARVWLALDTCKTSSRNSLLRVLTCKSEIAPTLTDYEQKLVEKNRCVKG